MNGSKILVFVSHFDWLLWKRGGSEWKSNRNHICVYFPISYLNYDAKSNTLQKVIFCGFHPLVKPLSVKVINPPDSLVADKRYEITCQSSGSRPNAIITWYKGKRQMRRTKDDILSHNTTISTLSFAPSTEDDGKTLTCRAENPNVNGLFLETTWRMNVVCE